MNCSRSGWHIWCSLARHSHPGSGRLSPCGSLHATTESQKDSHTKMEVLQRQAYGFRNLQNYRMRVKVLCS